MERIIRKVANFALALLLGTTVSAALVYPVKSLYLFWLEKKQAEEACTIMARDLGYLYQRIDFDYPTIDGYRIRITKAHAESLYFELESLLNKWNKNGR